MSERVSNGFILPGEPQDAYEELFMEFLTDLADDEAEAACPTLVTEETPLRDEVLVNTPPALVFGAGLPELAAQAPGSSAQQRTAPLQGAQTQQRSRQRLTGAARTEHVKAKNRKNQAAYRARCKKEIQELDGKLRTATHRLQLEKERWRRLRYERHALQHRLKTLEANATRSAAPGAWIARSADVTTSEDKTEHLSADCGAAGATGHATNTQHDPPDAATATEAPSDYTARSTAAFQGPAGVAISANGVGDASACSMPRGDSAHGPPKPHPTASVSVATQPLDVKDMSPEEAQQVEPDHMQLRRMRPAAKSLFSSLFSSTTEGAPPPPTGPPTIDSFPHHASFSFAEISTFFLPNRSFQKVPNFNVLCTAATEYRRSVCDKLACGAQDVCWFVQFPFQLSSGARMSHTATISSPECCLSLSLVFPIVSVECLFLLLEQELLEASIRSPGRPPADALQARSFVRQALREGFEGGAPEPLRHPLPETRLASQLRVRCGVNDSFPLKDAVTEVVQPVLLTYRNRLPYADWRAVCMHCMQILEEQITHLMRASPDAAAPPLLRNTPSTGSGPHGPCGFGGAGSGMPQSTAARDGEGMPWSLLDTAMLSLMQYMHQLMYETVVASQAPAQQGHTSSGADIEGRILDLMGSVGSSGTMTFQFAPKHARAVLLGSHLATLDLVQKERQQARAAAYLQLTADQKRVLGAKWHRWCRRRRALDSSLHSSLSRLTAVLPEPSDFFLHVGELLYRVLGDEMFCPDDNDDVMLDHQGHEWRGSDEDGDGGEESEWHDDTSPVMDPAHDVATGDASVSNGGAHQGFIKVVKPSLVADPRRAIGDIAVVDPVEQAPLGAPVEGGSNHGAAEGARPPNGGVGGQPDIRKRPPRRWFGVCVATKLENGADAMTSDAGRRAGVSGSEGKSSAGRAECCNNWGRGRCSNRSNSTSGGNGRGKGFLGESGAAIGALEEALEGLRDVHTCDSLMYQEMLLPAWELNMVQHAKLMSVHIVVSTQKVDMLRLMRNAAHELSWEALFEPLRISDV